MQLKRTPDGFHGWFFLQDKEGKPLPIPADDCQVAVLTPDDKRCLNPVVRAGRLPGMFFFQVPSNFIAQEGDYTVGITVPKHRILPRVQKVHVVH